MTKVRSGMKKVAFVFLAVLLASPAAADDIDQTLAADADGIVKVSNLSGEVSIVGWNRSEVRVTGEIGDDVEEFVFEVTGSQTIIKVKLPDHSGHFSDASADLVIRVPEGSSLDVGTVSADIDVEGVHGDQELQSVSGDVTVEVFGADVEAGTVSGDVDAEGNNQDSETDLESVSGDVSGTNLAGEVSAGSVSGDVEITDGSFSRAKIETVNGDIDFDANLREAGKLEVETVNGSVGVNFVGSVSAKFEIDTFNGRIRNCFGPEPRRTSRYAPGWELNFTEGDGNGRVIISTLNGGLNLCKE